MIKGGGGRTIPVLGESYLRAISFSERGLLRIQTQAQTDATLQGSTADVGGGDSDVPIEGSDWLEGREGGKGKKKEGELADSHSGWEWDFGIRPPPFCPVLSLRARQSEVTQRHLGGPWDDRSSTLWAFGGHFGRHSLERDGRSNTIPIANGHGIVREISICHCVSGVGAFERHLDGPGRNHRTISRAHCPRYWRWRSQIYHNAPVHMNGRKTL